jgi:protein-tyrosine phosphatase
VLAFAEFLVKQGLVHFVATDAHSTRSRCPKLAAAKARVAAMAGHRAAEALCCHNPARVAAGETVRAGARPQRPSRWAGWFGWRKAG